MNSVIKLILPIQLCSIIILSSCSSTPPISKNFYLKKFRLFVTEVEKYYKDYNQEDWEKADGQYDNYRNTYYAKFEDKLDESEKDEINYLTGKYSGLRLKGKANLFIQEFNKKVNETSETIQGFIEVLIEEKDTINQSDN